MKCSKCNQEINTGSPFCGSCGAKVENVSRFCPGCGTSVANDLKFCGTCGANLSDEVQQTQAVPTTQVVQSKFCGGCGQSVPFDSKFCGTCGFVFTDVVQQPAQPSAASIKFKETLTKIKDFIINHKIPVIAVTSIILVAIIGWICFQKFYDFTKLSWVENYGDYDVTHVTGGELKLKVEAYDKEESLITDIKYSADGGEVTSDGTKVTWVLPEKEGTYKITAEAPSGKKITKKVEIVKMSNNIDNPMPVGFDRTTEEITDNDGDGILNDEEKSLGTNPNLADTDSDGLSDYYEINESKTKPTVADTDGDGIRDGDELDLGLDPLKSDSKGDGIKDGDRELTYDVKNEKLDITIKITGKGNIASTTIDVLKNSTFEDMDGLLNTVYNFYTDGKVNSAIVTIKYDEAEIKAKGLDENNLTLYYFDEETKKLEPMPTKVNPENNTITVTLSHFSKYVIGDKNVVLVNNKAQILFVVDNSVSMYSEQQMIDAGYDSSTGAIGNDTEFKRLTLTNNMVGMFTGNYEFAVAEFSGNYVNLQDFSTNKDDIKTAVNKMKSKWNSDANGTDIIEALKSGINEFENDGNSHYLVLMTDGKNTEGSLSYNQSSIITAAKEKNIKVCVIGLGTNLDTDELDEIAEATGCDYYHASNSSALDEIYALVGADINYNLVDTDNDGKVDGMIVADSGFITTRDGFNFSNFRSVQEEGGNCFGMAMFAMLYYKDELPMQMSAHTQSKFYLRYFKTIEWTSSGYDLDNTYFESGEPLYEYNFQDEAVRLRLKDFPEDVRNRVEDKVFYVNKEYYDMWEKIGIKFHIKKYDGENKNIEKYQTVGWIDIENEKFHKNADNDDVQMLKAIWRLFMYQMDGDTLPFSGSHDKAYNKLVTELKSGNPMVIGINGNHAINAVRLIQDLEDANKFKLEVYDNNYPGEVRYIEITRNKYNKIQLNYTAWTNEYEYKFKYAGKDTTVELSLAEVN